VTTDEIRYARQKAIDDILRLMGCTDARASNCEHVEAVRALASACYQTLADQFGLMHLLEGIGAETHIKPGVTGRREGKLR
jgi:hypothetical protein